MQVYAAPLILHTPNDWDNFKILFIHHVFIWAENAKVPFSYSLPHA